MTAYTPDPSCHYHLRKNHNGTFTFDIKSCFSSEYQRPDFAWNTAEEALAMARQVVDNQIQHAQDCTQRYVNRINHPAVVLHDKKTTTFEHAPTSRVQLAHKDE
jgi:hypothetical protein